MTTFRAGVAQADITPPLGAALTGYIMRTGPASGIHDPLYAKALVLDAGDTLAAIVSCDLLGLEAASANRVAAAIEHATGIPAGHVLVACTHTHAGAASMFLQDCGDVDPAWLAECEARLVEIVQIAKMRLSPAALGAAFGTVTGGVQNRRTPGDVIDPALGVVHIVDPAGTPLAVVLNYACHPTVLGPENLLISADYPGVVMRALQSAVGAPCVFLTGAIGDVGPMGRGFAQLDQMGATLAREARRVLPNVPTRVPKCLAAASRTLALPLQGLPTVEELEEYLAGKRQLLEHAVSAGQPVQVKITQTMIHWAERTLVQLAGGMAPVVEATVQVLRLDGLVLVGVPGELFVELGLQIKAAAAPGDQVLVVGFANGNIGYIPARRAYARGGYEIDEAYRYYGYPSVLAPEAGEMVVQAASELLRVTAVKP